MNEFCNDNRFEIIAKAKRHLLEATNIDSRPEEMAVIDSILFRCWQMGWLNNYEPTQKAEPENNLLVCFPYGMDQKYIYHIPEGSGGRIERLRAQWIGIRRTITEKPFYQIDGFDFTPEDFGKNVFLTKEEAWNALEKYWDGKYQEDE